MHRCASQTSAKNQLQAKPLRTHTQRMHELKGIPRPEHVVPLFDNIVCGSELTIWKYCKIRQLNEGTTLQGLGTQAAREPRSCNEFPHLRNRFRQDWLVCSLHWYEKTHCGESVQPRTTDKESKSKSSYVPCLLVVRSVAYYAHELPYWCYKILMNSLHIDSFGIYYTITIIRNHPKK